MRTRSGTEYRADLGADVVDCWERVGRPGWWEHELPELNGRRTWRRIAARCTRSRSACSPQGSGRTGRTDQLTRWLGLALPDEERPAWSEMYQVIGARSAAGVCCRLGRVHPSTDHSAALESGCALDALGLADDRYGAADDLIDGAIQIFATA